MTKGAPALSGLLVDYLKKDKDLELQKLEQQDRTTRAAGPENRGGATETRLAEKEQAYSNQLGSELKLSGEIFSPLNSPSTNNFFEPSKLTTTAI